MKKVLVVMMMVFVVGGSRAMAGDAGSKVVKIQVEVPGVKAPDNGKALIPITEFEQLMFTPGSQGVVSQNIYNNLDFFVCDPETGEEEVPEGRDFYFAFLVGLGGVQYILGQVDNSHYENYSHFLEGEYIGPESFSGESVVSLICVEDADNDGIIGYYDTQYGVLILGGSPEDLVYNGSDFVIDGIRNNLPAIPPFVYFSPESIFLPPIVCRPVQPPVVDFGDGLEVCEGLAGGPPTSDSFTVVLQESPESGETVVVTPTSYNLGESDVLIEPNYLVFDEGNWDEPQTITVTAIDDDLLEGSPEDPNEMIEIVLEFEGGGFGNPFTGPDRWEVFAFVYDNECGVWGHLTGDLNKDCKVSITDFVILASDWLECTLPSQAGCFKPD